MSVSTDDLGVLGNLAVALGLFTPGGSPNPSWFGDPETSLSNMLSDNDQRAALIAFVDEAMGGADRTTDPRGVVWLPIVHIDDPDLTIAVTIDDTPAEGLHIGLGISVRTSNPHSESTLAVPLFRAHKEGGPSVPNAILLGSNGGRIRVSTAITVTDSPPVPGQARLGAIGIDVDVPTSPADPVDPIFGLSLTGFQLPGAASPRDIRVAADGLDELDDALLDLVLSLVKAQADAAASGSPIAAVGGLLGLKSGDNVPDFPITQLPTQGAHALAAWVHDIVTTTASRVDWMAHLASLLGGTPSAGAVTFHLGAAELTLGLRVDAGPTGNTRLSPTLGIGLAGAGDTRVEARADLFQIDLVSGAAVALPQLGLWAAAGAPGAGHRVLDVSNPVARADTLRVGFALDSARRLTFVLAADGVTLGSHQYPTLDLTSPDALMDAVGNTVSDVAGQLLAGCGDALTVVRLLLGLDAPAGIAAVGLPALMTDPAAAVSGYWRDLIQAPPGAMTTVLAAVRDALADASGAASSVKGTGTQDDPWRVALIGPLEIEAFGNGSVLTIGLAATTSVDTLGQQCTVVTTRFGVTLAEVDLAAKTGKLLPGVEGLLSARERGINPPRILLPFGDGAALTASGVGLRLGWSPTGGLVADVRAPNLALTAGSVTLPIALPVIAADGTVTLPAAAWDGLEVLVGYFGELLGGFIGDVAKALGWSPELATAGGPTTGGARLRLSDLIADPAAALGNWLPQLLMSEVGPEALRVLADLFAGSGANRGFIEGTGHPDDPYRFAIADALPQPIVWFPPAGLERQIVAVSDGIQRWRPGDPGLGASALAAALQTEASVAADINELVDGRDVAGGLTALAQRWVGGDGRIVPPDTAPGGVTVDRSAVAAGQLLSQIDLRNLTGRVPTTTVYVAIGATAWPAAPAGRRVDLTASGLDASMFAPPAAATGDWFVALGGRTACLLAGSGTDGTPEQAARLRRVLDSLAGVSNDIVVVALAGSGHAARLAVEAQTAVTDLVTLGTPLGPIALTAISTQPTADALRLLNRLLPTPPPSGPLDPPSVREDDDLALGRALVGSMMELVDRADPSLDLRQPTIPPSPPRAGLAMRAVFGSVTDSQVRRAMTAIVAAGLAERARTRAATPLPDATGLGAGVRIVLPPTVNGTLSVSGDALVMLFAYDTATGADTSRHLRVRLRVGDRLGWLTSTPDAELRKVTADIFVPLDGTGAGQASITLHDARVFGQSWERLIVGTAPGSVPVLPEVRVLLAAAVQRLTTDVAGSASVALAQLLTGFGIIDPAGGVAGDAVDQLVHDPTGFVGQRFAAAATQIKTAANALLGPIATSVDFDARSVRVNGGSDTSGRFGWHADVTAGPAGVSGHLQLGANASGAATGQLNFVVDFNPLHASLVWHRTGGTTDTIALWPGPDAASIARAIASAAPSLGGHVALELMRRADDTARPVIDAVLDAMGMLSGTAGDLDRAIRPLAGLLADPAGWLRSSESLAANPAKIQALFDALRPLLGVAGAPGSPIPLASGVSLAVTTDGPGARLTLQIDPTAWTTPNGVTGRLAAGVGTTLTVGPSGPPVFGFDAFVGLTGAVSGRQAVHTRIGAGGIELFLRPASGGDISLIPFAGLGSLAAAAEAALPFLLDKLATVPGTVGDLVQTVGDALALRSGNPKHFDGAALHAWGTNPVGALTSALPSITTTGLTTIAPLLDAFMPAAVSATATTNQLTVTVGDFSASWNPGAGIATIVGDDISVPGIDRISFTVALSAAGLNELSVTVGPAAINAGGVMLRPFVTVAAGLSPANGRRIAVGMALDDTHRFAARWLFDTHAFAFVSSDGAIATAIDATDPAQVALRVVEAVADLVAGVAMAQQAVQNLLNTAAGATNVRNLMRGVVLQDVNNPSALIGGLFDPSTLLARIHKLFVNIAGAGIGITVEGLHVSFATANNTIGLQAQLVDRLALVTGDVMLWLENDGTWIEDNNPPKSGLFVGFLPTTLPLTFKPNLAVYGLGLRIGKNSGPLLDFGITLDSIALHAFAELDAGGARSGGVQLQFSNLAVSADGAGGDNGIAQGVMKDTGPTPPKPAFSPALAIQKHGHDPVSVTLRAGDGDGPWWIAIQRGFGPLYLEQVGFGVTMPNRRVDRISLLMDGSVSMFGLTCAVDDLQITYITSNGDFFNPASWAIDLAGLAVSANMAGVQIAGGLLKQTTPNGIEYLGMLLGRFGVYGLTIFGGYGEGIDQGQKFTAFFAVGAINGPIGGPPAFFLMGIGGGFGINRRLIVPTDLSKFGDYPLIQALDIAAKPQDPMDQLRALGQYFPMQKGTFWFAAGLAFNSFALVDGIAVVAVQIGDGLDINLLGLARMALPRPQVALVSIEVALLVRFSSSEGVLWVQAQLTDNSWLLYPDIKLTGGFAYVIWFKGEHRGEFVFTLGGYHPEFHRDGYPVVPRLGLRWSIGDAITIKAGCYFALTSEALMAGGDFEASAHFGPAWAEVKFGANGIVYFDPFHYHVDAYARIAAGITIDTWIFGEITISISLGARIDVTGPDFHGTATFEVGPIELSVEFGGSDKAQKQPMAASAFIAKYLDAADDASARAHAVVTSFGSLPSKGDKATPDGSAERPFIVVVEFGLTFTSTVPATAVTQSPSNATTQHAPSRALGVAPMLASNVLPTITLEWQRSGAVQTFPFAVTARPFGSFPVGVWGLPQDPDNRKVPKAEMIEALNELNLESRAAESVAGPEIPYYQVEIGKRKPLPFTRRTIDAAKLKSDALAVAGLISEPVSVATAFQAAIAYLAATATPTALASMRGERQSPPLLGTLAERIDESGITVKPGVGQKPPSKIYDHFVDPPVAVGLLSGAAANLRVASPARTTVKDSARAWRVAPPTLAAVQADRSRSIAARLVVADQRAMSTSRSSTVIAVTAPPPTSVAHAASTLVQRTGAAGTEHLAAFSAGLLAQTAVGVAPRATAPRGTAGATLTPGQIVVLKMPNAHADTAMTGDRPRLGVSGAPARVVILGHGGVVQADQNVGDGATIEIARGAERIVAVGQGTQAEAHAGLVGWHAGLQMAYAGWSTGIAPGCVVRSAGEPLRMHRERVDAGWVSGAELARGESTVTTTFTTAPTTVVVVLDDPAAFGDIVDGRTLLLGLDGARRAVDPAGRERPPVLLVAENRSVLGYDVVPDGNRPVVVTIATQAGWSLVGVMGSAEVGAAGAIALVSARGLDAAIHPFASTASNANDMSRLVWIGPTRTVQERRLARMRASARPPMTDSSTPSPAPVRKPSRPVRKGSKPAAAPRKAAKKTANRTAKPGKRPTASGRAKGRSKGRR